jgi:putative nucleotidyltransferase with HDIG domain
MLGKLFGKKDAAHAYRAQPLRDALRRTILGSLGLKSIPAMPQAAQKAFQLATNPKAEAHDFIDLVESDEALSARVLKIANSVFYDRGGGSKTIPDAVQVIGISELRGLLNASALSDLFALRHPLRAQLWAHDIATGLTARALARRALPSQVDLAFLGGLMHDVGKLLMLQRHTDTYERIMKQCVSQSIEPSKAEAEEYPFDHTQVGQMIAERWNFSDELTAVIRGHHEPWSNFPSLSIVSLVKGADIISHSLGLGFQRELANFKSIFADKLDETWEALRVPAGERRALLDEIKRTFETEYDLYASWGGG